MSSVGSNNLFTGTHFDFCDMYISHLLPMPLVAADRPTALIAICLFVCLPVSRSSKSYQWIFMVSGICRLWTREELMKLGKIKVRVRVWFQ